MAQIISIYGLVAAVIISNNLTEKMALHTAFMQLGAGLAVGLCGLAAGFAIGIIGDAGGQSLLYPSVFFLVRLPFLFFTFPLPPPFFNLLFLSLLFTSSLLSPLYSLFFLGPTLPSFATPISSFPFLSVV